MCSLKLCQFECFLSGTMTKQAPIILPWGNNVLDQAWEVKISDLITLYFKGHRCMSKRIRRQLKSSAWNKQTNKPIFFQCTMTRFKLYDHWYFFKGAKFEYGDQVWVGANMIIEWAGHVRQEDGEEISLLSHGQEARHFGSFSAKHVIWE